MKPQAPQPPTPTLGDLEGEQVRAMTYKDDDRELPPREVRGILQTRGVPILGYTQCFVDSTLVNPATVQPLTSPAPQS